MDFNTETEPLLDKKDINLEINDKLQNEFILNQKSKRQILNRACSCSDFCENLMFCCIDYDLTNRQYELYNDLKNNLSFPYNQNDLNHEKLLQDFFDNIKDLLKDEEEDYENINDSNTISTNINNENNNNQNDLIKKLAYRVGFQNDNPRTDFRAGGFCSAYRAHRPAVPRQRHRPHPGRKLELLPAEGQAQLPVLPIRRVQPVHDHLLQPLRPAQFLSGHPGENGNRLCHALPRGGLVLSAL